MGIWDFGDFGISGFRVLRFWGFEGFGSREWDGFYDSNWSEMQFQNGESCWNGPPRSITVHLECGLTNEVLSVDEPSRCE